MDFHENVFHRDFIYGKFIVFFEASSPTEQQDGSILVHAAFDIPDYHFVWCPVFPRDDDPHQLDDLNKQQKQARCLHDVHHSTPTAHRVSVYSSKQNLGDDLE